MGISKSLRRKWKFSPEERKISSEESNETSKESNHKSEEFLRCSVENKKYPPRNSGFSSVEILDCWSEKLESLEFLGTNLYPLTSFSYLWSGVVRATAVFSAQDTT